MEPKPVSRKLLKRLPVYLNYLKNLPEDSPNISATTMARALELGDVQVRKDLGKISTGRSRTGRNRHQLMQDIEAYLAVGIFKLVVIDDGVQCNENLCSESVGIFTQPSYLFDVISGCLSCSEPRSGYIHSIGTAVDCCDADL